MPRLQFTVTALAVGLALTATGCGAKPTPTKGTVTFNGAPLAKATVVYTPEEPSGKSATGFTDDQGAFELTTFTRHDGAVPGVYKVTVHPAATIEGAPIAKGPGGAQQANANARPKIAIPEIYTRPDQTPLRRKVPAAGETKIELSDMP